MNTKPWKKTWNTRKSASEQRKFRTHAPIHIRSKFLNAPLTKELRNKYVSPLRVITGDKVKVLKGQYKGQTGKVEHINTKNTKIYLTGVERQKIDGSKALYPIHPSNVIITELNLKDKKRVQRATKQDNKKLTQKTSEAKK